MSRRSVDSRGTTGMSSFTPIFPLSFEVSNFCYHFIFKQVMGVDGVPASGAPAYD